MKGKEIRCNSCRRNLKKNDIREEEAWSKKDGKVVKIRICKFCGEIVRTN